MRYDILLPIILTLTLLHGPIFVESQSWAIQGQITSSLGGDPIPGIEVTLSSDCNPLERDRGLNRSTKTASDGTYRFDHLPYRLYSISTFPAQYTPAGLVYVRPGKEPGNIVDFGLDIIDPVRHRKMNVYGTVTSKSGKAVSNAKVILQCILNPVIRYETRTDDGGKFSIDLTSAWNGPAGHYYLTAFKGDVGFSVKGVTFLRDNEEFQIDLRLEAVRH